MNEMNDSVTN